MIVNTKEFQEKCKDILFAIDSKQLTNLADKVELVLENNNFILNTTNKQYFVSIKFTIDNPKLESFRVTVDAKLFLNLIAKLTTETITLNAKDTYLQVKSNGTYKIPYIFDNDKMLVVPEIKYKTETTNFKIKLKYLLDIYNYNTKEVLKATIESPVNDKHYLDEHGCITYNNGACITSFELDTPIRILIDNKVAKLFKLFKSDEVSCHLGLNAISSDIIQTIFILDDGITKISSIVNYDTKLFDWFPIDALRKDMCNDLPYSIVIDKNNLVNSLSRLKLFNSGLNTKAIKVNLEIQKDKIIISDINDNNNEELEISNTINSLESTYSTKLFVNDLDSTLKNITDQYLTINFGNNQAFIIVRDNIKIIIPEATD